MKKRISIALALIMVFLTLTACGGGNGDNAATSAAPNTSSVEAEALVDAEPSDASASGDKPKVCLLMGKSTSPYSGTYFMKFKESMELYPDIEWHAFDAQSDATLQAQQADEAIAMGAAVIMMQPIDSNALIASAQKISEAGIPLVICNTKLAPEGDDFITCFYGPDLYQEGVLAADLMAEKFPDGCKYVHLGQDPSNETGRLRLAGFVERSEEAGYNFELLGTSPSCDWQAEKGKVFMSAFLSQFPGDIDAVWAIDDAVGYGALQAVQEDMSGMNDDIQIVSVGGQEANLAAIKQNTNYLGTIYQSPRIEVEGAMTLVSDIVKGNMPEEKNLGMDLPTITIENVDETEVAY